MPGGVLDGHSSADHKWGGQMLRKIFTGLIYLVAAIVSARAQPTVATNSWGANYFPDVPVVTQDGQTMHFYSDMIKGKIVVVNFVFTSCSDLCPIVTARLAQVKEMLGDAVGRDIFFISISVDPEHDTPDMLKAFADAFEVSAPGWQFLTGRPQDIDAINAKFGDRSAQRTLKDHRNEILIGNDLTGDWQRDSALNDVNQLVMSIHLMDPKWTGPAVAASSQTAGDTTNYRMSNQPGQVLFKRMCAPCHAIGGGDHAGPDLRGVADRRDHAWLVDFIMDPAKMLARKDPDALALAARFRGVHMPAIGLGETDAADVISYLRDQTSRLSASSAVPK
jgi:protein SCO1/2